MGASSTLGLAVHRPVGNPLSDDYAHAAAVARRARSSGGGRCARARAAVAPLAEASIKAERATARAAAPCWLPIDKGSWWPTRHRSLSVPHRHCNRLIATA
jgi:hypothetical protein